MRIRQPGLLAALRVPRPHLYVLTDTTLTALQAATGVVQWTWTLPSAHAGPLRPKVDCDLDYVWVAANDSVYQLDRGGTLQWTRQRTGQVIALAAGPDGKSAALWRGTSDTDTVARIRGYDAAGNALWTEVTADVGWPRPAVVFRFTSAAGDIFARYARTAATSDGVTARSGTVTIGPSGLATVTSNTEGSPFDWGVYPEDPRNPDMFRDVVSVTKPNQATSRRWQIWANASGTALRRNPSGQVVRVAFPTGNVDLETWLSGAPGDPLEQDNRRGFYTAAGSVVSAWRDGPVARWTYDATDTVDYMVAEPGRWATGTDPTVRLPTPT